MKASGLVLASMLHSGMTSTHLVDLSIPVIWPFERQVEDHPGQRACGRICVCMDRNGMKSAAGCWWTWQGAACGLWIRWNIGCPACSRSVGCSSNRHIFCNAQTDCVRLRFLTACNSCNTFCHYLNFLIFFCWWVWAKNNLWCAVTP